MNRKFRTVKCVELFDFKALVVFVFTVYGIIMPLWFVFYGNKLLGNNNQWIKIVVDSSNLVAPSQRGKLDSSYGGHKNEWHSSKRDHARARKRRQYLIVTLPKPLHRVELWPRPKQPRQRQKTISGRLLSMKWENLCCQSINCLRKYPLFPLLPSKQRFLRELRVSEKENMYGQRIAGVLRPPENGDYAIYMKCPFTCEFWLSDTEYPIHSKLLKKIVNSIPVKLVLKENKSRPLIFKASLQTGRAYFVDILITVYRNLNRSFEVLWKLPSASIFVPLSKEYFAGFQKNPPHSLRKVIHFYSYSPSVHLTPYLESIEEPGEDDDDFPILGAKTSNTNHSFLDSQERAMFLHAQHANIIALPKMSENVPYSKECVNRIVFLRNKTIKKYSGIWKTSFSSVFPGDNTGYMMCIGNRYPQDCHGNRMMKSETLKKVLTFYSRTVDDSKTKKQRIQTDETKRIYKLLRIEERKDDRNGSLFLVNAIMKNLKKNSTYYNSQYLYMANNSISPCSPEGYAINWNVTVNVIVVAKGQTRWLRHFLANMEKIYVSTNDNHINVIIAKYGNDNDELMHEYKSNRLPNIRMIRHHGVFDKRTAIHSAVKKIQDQNSIIFLMDLHIAMPNTIIQLVRERTVQNKLVFNPVLFRLSHCGSMASTTKPARGFWETFGYGILGIYKSDWDKLSRVKSKRKGWGGEDWELLDRVLTSGLGVQRLRIPNFYHFYHSKKGMWN